MAILEQVMNMKKQGIPEEEIIKNLQHQGTSPKEISDALTQSQIKQAVSQEDQSTQGMQPSIMGTSLSEAQVPQNPEANQSNPPEEEIYQPQMQSNYAQEQQVEEYYPQEGYEEYSYTDTNVDSVIEISEQVFSEKSKTMQNQIRELMEIKTIFKTKIENIDERLKRMEKMFDQMQISIIEKVGNYGKSLETLKKELNMVEDSFSKIVDKTISKKKTTSKKK